MTLNGCDLTDLPFVMLIIIYDKLVGIFFNEVPCNRFDKRLSYVSQAITFFIVGGWNIFLLFKNIGRYCPCFIENRYQHQVLMGNDHTTPYKKPAL